VEKRMRKASPEKSVGNEKLMPQILDLLEKRSGRSLEEARRRLLMVKVETTQAREALEHYAKNWNDTIHPAILSLSCDAVADELADVLDMQVIILFLTAAMDIHDDVIDKSKIKGDKTTIYGKFGEDLAILMGDALLLEGFMMLHEYKRSITLESFNSIMEIIKNSFFEIGNAHLMELQLKRKTSAEPDEYLRIVEKKAAIFEGICKIGAIIGKGSENQVNAIKTYGRTLGFLAMLREEFIDMFEPDELQSRMINECLPLPIAYALDDPKVRKLITKLRGSKKTHVSIHELINMVYENKNVIRLKRIMEERAEQAVGTLTTLNLRKKPALDLATLIRGTLEDL
jgi:geranylgeranyl diphosphate synthase type II